MRRRTTSAVGGALLAIALLTACVPEPAPSPTPTGFASEDEAFAAAEATYRAYIDALNTSRDDPEHEPSPESFLSGEALDQSLDVSEQLSDAGLTIVGPANVISVEQVDWNSSSATISTCMDYENARLHDATGNDVTPEDRPSVASLIVKVVYSKPQPLIVESTSDGQEC